MRDTHCGQCGKELEWEEETPGYHTARCQCGRRYSLLRTVIDEARRKLPAWAKKFTCSGTHSWEQRARIDVEYHGEIQT